MSNPTPQPDPKALASELQRYREIAEKAQWSESGAFDFMNIAAPNLILHLLDLLTSTQEENEELKRTVEKLWARADDDDEEIAGLKASIQTAEEENERLKAELFLPGAGHNAPAVCPTWHDSCNCTVDNLSGQIDYTRELLAKLQSAEFLLSVMAAIQTALTLSQAKALGLAEGRLAMLLTAELPGSDHPVATEYVLSRVRDALSSSPDLVGGDQGVSVAGVQAAPDGATEDALFPGLSDQAGEAIENGDGFWRSCSGCYETEDGQNVHGYPHSKALRCVIGGGCSECGGLGAIWDTTDYEAMGRDLANRLGGFDDVRGWRDIETAPKAETSSEPPISVILEWFNITENGGCTYHVGEGYWQADAEAWWWANTAPGDYYSDSIEESITGKVTRWMSLPEPAPSDPSPRGEP